MYLKYQLVRDCVCFQRQVSSDNRISPEILGVDKLASPADHHPHTQWQSLCPGSPSAGGLSNVDRGQMLNVHV